MRNVKSDTPFRRRMRLHQSWWRENQGLAMGADARGSLGSLINEKDAQEGKNFLNEGIREVAEAAVGNRHVSMKRLRENLLSSQPMAFNLFGPLVGNQELACDLIASLLGVRPKSATVCLEFAPTPKEDYLCDETSFDALIDCQFFDGERGIIAVETKLSEPFSPATKGKFPDRPIYRAVACDSGLYINPDDKSLAESDCWQLWRNHLLLELYRRKLGAGLAQAWVIHHELDRDAAHSIAKYQSKLKEGSAATKGMASPLRALTLDEVVSAWETTPGISHSTRDWLAAFRTRYLDLGRSEEMATLSGCSLRSQQA